MKKTYVFIAAVLTMLASCGSDANKNTEPPKDIKEQAAPVAVSIADTKDSAKWIDDFRAFRDAVYQNNRAKVKEFIDFPLTENVNYIWSIIGDEKRFGDTVPFTEKDFDKYYDKLFTKTFIKCLLKIKSEELYKKGEAASPEFKEGETTTSLDATVDKEKNRLRLNLFSKGSYKIAEGEYDAAEYGVMYEFDILKSGKIKLKQ